VGGIGGWVPSPKQLPFDFEPWALAPGVGTTAMLGRDGQLWTWGLRWGTTHGVGPLSRLLSRYPRLDSLFRSDIDRPPHRLWALPPAARVTSGTESIGSGNNLTTDGLR